MCSEMQSRTRSVLHVQHTLCTSGTFRVLFFYIPKPPQKIWFKLPDISSEVSVTFSTQGGAISKMADDESIYSVHEVYSAIPWIVPAHCAASPKALTKSHDFTSPLKVSIFSSSRIWWGNWFQSPGPHTAKPRSPKFVLVLLTTSPEGARWPIVAVSSKLQYHNAGGFLVVRLQCDIRGTLKEQQESDISWIYQLHTGLHGV